MKKWQDLLATLEVTGSEKLPSEEDIGAFEEATKIILPAGFKE